MTNQPILSVVVPIYKVERYLRQCIDSLINQTLKDIEIILVDDGSPDGCPTIVDEYAMADSRVVAIHQENGGYGKAMNHGISRARGKYVGILESDDWAESTLYEKMVTKAESTNADIVKCGHYIYNSAQIPMLQSTPWIYPHINIFRAPDGAFFPMDWKEIFLFHTGPWSWIYRAELIRQVQFPETRASYQDIPFIFDVLSRNPRMAVVKDFLIHYRTDEDSGSSSNQTNAKVIKMADMTLAARNILEKRGLLEAVQEEFFMHAFGTHLPLLERIQKQYRQEYFDKIHEIFKWLKDSKNFKAQYFVFGKKQKKILNYFIKGGSCTQLFKKWSIKVRFRALVRLAGVDVINTLSSNKK